MGRHRNDEQRYLVGTRVNEALYTRLGNLSHASKLSMAHIIRTAITNHLQETTNER